MNQVKIGNVLKTGFIWKNKKHTEKNNHRGKREYWKTMKTRFVNKDVDLKEDRDSQETMVLYGPIWV